MKQTIAAFARNTVFANIVLILIFLAGGMAAFMMLRETFPNFSLDTITITVAYPGAGPEEVEEGISRKIENALEGLEGIKQVTTKSYENVGTVLIEVKDNYDVSKVLDKVRTKVNAIPTFPVNAEKPIISDVAIRNLVVLVSLTGNMSERRLKEWAEEIEDEIQQYPNISQVDVFGTRDYEISIEVSEERLREYGLTFNQVTDAVRNSNLNLASGTIRTQSEEIRVRTVGRKYTAKELASIVVLARAEGEIITLNRLATINDGFAEDPIYAAVNGKPAILLNVYKTQEEDALSISRTVSDFVEQKQQQVPKGFNIKILYDNTERLQSRTNLLLKNGVIGLCLVFMILWLFMGRHLSFWVGIGIPVSLAGALAITWAIGGTINMISLFGLIMVLGIIVDDGIIVGEAIYLQRERGAPPLKAAVQGVYEVGMPVIAAVSTNIIAFLPLAFLGGIIGKFIFILPAVVIACLVVSLLECFLLLPAHLNNLPDLNAKREKRSPWRHPIRTFRRFFSLSLEWGIQRIYAPFINKVLKLRYLSLCATVSILLATIGLLQSGILKFNFLPEIDGFVLNAAVEFPSGTPPKVTQDAIEQLDAALLRLAKRTKTRSGDPLIKDRVAVIGQTADGSVEIAGPNVGGMRVILLESEKRGIHSKDLAVEWEKEVGLISGVKSLTFEGLEAGADVPIEVWLQGHDMEKILAAAEDLIDRLRRFDGVYQVHSDHRAGKNELRLELKQEARALGLTVGDLAEQIHAGYFGQEALRLQRGREDIRVKVRYTADERRKISDLNRIRIRTKSGHEVPLLSVANVSFEPGFSTIIRSDGMRRVTVTATVDSKIANPNEIVAELSQGYFSSLKAKYPGLFMSVHGEQQNIQESFRSLFVGYPLAIIGIFIIVATIFRSYAQPFVILFTVPFGIIGGVLGHLVLGYNLSIMSVFGIVALTGVVVNDAIVLIERVNVNLAQGMQFFEAVCQGSCRRFRAIFLTTISTVGGLAPLILETDLQARYLIPMAISLAGGVMFATVLTLVLIPSLLAILNDLRCFAYFLRRSVWPPREIVEPARHRKLEVIVDKPKWKALPEYEI